MHKVFVAALPVGLLIGHFQHRRHGWVVYSRRRAQLHDRKSHRIDIAGKVLRVSLLRTDAKLADPTGGWGGIRTHGALAGTPVFKTGPLNHSGTHPADSDLPSRGLPREGR